MPVNYALLPGQQLWKNDVSSYLFGTEDTTEFSPPSTNIGNTPAIQALVKVAGFTVLRSYIPDGSSDGVLATRLATAQACGCPMLIVLPNTASSTWNAHVVTYFGANCLMYEFGNEPDNSGEPFPVSASTYVTNWNAQVPNLRSINANAKFIGPVTAGPNSTYMTTFLNGVVTSGVYPDALSFHEYPAYFTTDEGVALLSSTINQMTTDLNSTRTLCISILGRELPLCVTEWNINPGNPVPEYMKDGTFVSTWFQQGVLALIAGGCALASCFDAASNAGTYLSGTKGALDMIDTATATPKAQYYALQNLITFYQPYILLPTATRRGSNLSNHRSLILADNPQAYLRMGEQTGIIALDSSPNQNNAAIYGGYTLKNTGAMANDTDTSILLNGTSGWMQLPTTLKTDGWSALTIEMWLYLSTASYSGGPRVIANEDSVTTNHIGFSFILAAVNTGQSGFFDVGNGTTAGVAAFGTGTMAANIWKFITLLYDGGTVRIFVNGVQDNQTQALTGTIGTATHPISIGRDAGAAGDYFPGAIDELAIYNYALSYAQIQNHYQLGTTARRDMVILPTAIRRQS